MGRDERAQGQHGGLAGLVPGGQGGPVEVRASPGRPKVSTVLDTSSRSTPTEAQTSRRHSAPVPSGRPDKDRAAPSASVASGRSGSSACARAVDPGGRVTGLDLLAEMCRRGRDHARDCGLGNVGFVVAEMEAMPLPDESVDLVIFNGVVNLSARKMRALFECARVLRRGGGICLTDVTIDETRLPPQVLTHPAAWSGCAAGALAERTLLRSLHRVGLTRIQVQERHPLGIEDCARFPLFTAELLAIMRATIPAHDQDEIATCVTVTARKGSQDDAAGDFIASDEPGNQTAAPAVFDDMDEHLPTFDAGDRHCGDGLGGELRSWWDTIPPGTRTVVAVRDPSTKTDVPSLARMLGHTVELMTGADGALRVTIRVKGR